MSLADRPRRAARRRAPSCAGDVAGAERRGRASGRRPPGAEADALLARARAEGEAEGRARGRARAGRGSASRAHMRCSRARRASYDALLRCARARPRSRCARTPATPSCSSRLAAAARRDLGADAELEVDPPELGGVLARGRARAPSTTRWSRSPSAASTASGRGWRRCGAERRPPSRASAARWSRSRAWRRPPARPRRGRRRASGGRGDLAHAATWRSCSCTSTPAASARAHRRSCGTGR